MATIKLLKIATTGSGHFCPGPTPAVSLIPPTPPAGPITAPFVYMSRSASASKTETQLKIQGEPVLVKGSLMDIERPGNLPGQPTGGDVVTHMVCSQSEVFTGRFTVHANGKQVACTGESARMNVPYGGGFTAQAIGNLITLDTILFATTPWNLGATSQVILDPVSVVSGAVVDSDELVSIPGLIPIMWKRVYDSQRSEHGPLGRGGWTHSFDQWIEHDSEELRFRDDDGSTLVVRGASPGKPYFHRRKRIEITHDGRGGATVFSTESRLRRVFRPLGGSRAHLVEITNACGHRVSFDYEGEKLVRVVDTARRPLVLEHDARGHVSRISVFGPGGAGSPLQTFSFGYDEDDALVSVTDPLGHVSRYTYDARRRLVKKTLPTGLSFHYVYDDETNRCIRSYGDGGIHAGDIAYDLAEATTRLTGNPAPRVFSWRPDDGALTAISLPDGSASRSFTYDEDGIVLEEKNAAGHGPRCEYDERGNLVRITDPEGNVSERTYHDDLLVRRVVQGRVTEYSYNARGQLDTVKYPGGAFITLGYDPHGRLVTIEDPGGLRARFVWDEHNNCVEEHTRTGLVNRWRYDALGRPVGYVDPQGNEVWRELDALGRVLAHRNPDGSVVRFEYDALGRKTKRTDELGRVTTIKYAGIDSAVETVREDGSVWTVHYDLAERPQRIENPKRERYDLRYDRLGRMTELRTFDGRILRASYGKNGEMSRLELPDGSFRSYQYDARNELVEENTPHGSGKIVCDEAARTTSFILSDPAGTISIVHASDELGRVISTTQGGRVIRYELDDRNRRVAMHLPSGKSTRWIYDERGLVKAIEHGGERVELGHDGSGALAGYRFARSGVEVRFVDDARGRAVREWVGKDGVTLSDRTYAWDACSVLTSKRDARFGEVRYRHDDLGRLVEASSAKGHERFEYDAADSVMPAGAGWDIGPGNVLRRTSTAAYEYDASNRRIRRTSLKTGAKTEYFWDCRNQLREVVREDGTRVLMTYDLFGRRVRKEVIAPLRPTSRDVLPELPARRVVEYLWDGDLLVAEIDDTRGERTLVHHPGSMAPLLQGENDCVLGLVTNHIGQATELVDEKGNIVFAGLYSAWGDLASVEGPSGRTRTPMTRSLGHYHDEDVGLLYTRHRWFDPEVMRFLSADPLGIEGGANLFAFNGSPVMAVDPLGLACMLIGNPRVDPALDHIIKYGPRNNQHYQVYVHGSEHRIHLKNPDGGWSHFGPDWLVQRMKDANNFHNEPVLLNSCNTGRRADGFAYQLSQRHGLAVYAPNEMVWGAGQAIGPPIGVFDSRRHTPNPGGDKVDPTRPGQWNYWYPGGFPHRGNRPPSYDTLPPPPP